MSGITNHKNIIECRFVKYLICFFIISNNFTLLAQIDKNIFNKIHIEIDGEEIYDISEIVQDHQGYIWMVTNLGLIRYSGLEGEKYNAKVNDASIVKDDVETLFVDFQGDLWIGSKSGLSKYNPDCDCIYRYPPVNDGTSLVGIRSIAEDKNHDLWFGTQTGGLYRYNKENNVITRFLHEPSDSITLAGDIIEQLLVDQNNNLWIGTNSLDPQKGSGLIRISIDSGDIKQFLHEPGNPNSLIDNRISALYEDQQGQILIGTYKSGFHKYNSKNESINRIRFDANNPGQIHAPFTEDKVYDNDAYVNIIHQDHIGDYWIGTTGKGINYFNARTNTFKNYNFELVNPQLLWSLYEDKNGIVWIGGVGGSGLFKTDLFARQYKLNTNFINVEASYQSALDPETLWVKSREGGLSKIDLKTGQFIRYMHAKDNIKSIGHNWVRSVLQENKTTLWIGLGTAGVEGVGAGNGGVDRMDIESETFTHFKLTRNDDTRNDFSYTPITICEDSEGYLWLGTGVGGIFRSDKAKKEFNHFKLFKNDTIPRDVILNIVRIDSNGDLWVSDFKDDGILYLYDRNEDTFNPFLKGFKVTNVVKDQRGWLCISTWEKGLLHLNPEDGNYIQYTKEDGLPSNDAIDIVKGNKGIFWIGTRMGPAQFDAETGKIFSVGLPKGRYNFGIFISIDNQIYLGANNGLVSFYPHQVTGNPFPPQIDISELIISNTNYLTGKRNTKELVLSHNQNDISFKYNALHFSNSERNSYQYRLKPLDDKWINAGFERTARYFNLPPGSYTFEVKAANSDGVWSDKPESVHFLIKSSWWTRWWAYILYIALLAFMIYRIDRFQVSRKLAVSESKRLKEINQLKNTLFTNITHEFRTPLTVIKGMADSIKSNLENKQLDDLENSLEIIDRNSDSLLHLVNEMLDLAKIESGNMELQLVQTDIIPFLKYTSESFSSLAEENQISLTVYSETETLLMDFDANKLTSIVSNLLSNAIKFTPEYGKIIVHIKQIIQKENSFLFIKIKDSGIGISSDELPNIFNRFYQAEASTIRKEGGTGIGLALTKELVDLMNGTIEAKSTLNGGSEFSVLIPVTKKAPISEHVEFAKVPHTASTKILSTQSNQITETDSELPLVLIIEDNMDVVHYLKTCLKNKYETIHAINGIQGIEMALEEIPDIIISDVMMPGKDGFEVCEKLKTDELTDHIPIIMLTAKATFEDRLTGLSHGADAYLIKPFEQTELLIHIDQLILLRKKMLSKFEKTGIDRLLNKNVKNTETKFLQKIITVIHDNITQTDLGPVQLARQLHLSESQLYRKLKATSGKSTAVFIRSIRLQKGKELIQTTDKTISEIAYDVGFNDPSWFSRVFKEEFGHTPGAISK